MADVQAPNLPLEIIDCAACMASGSTATLPHNSAVIALVVVT
jgi:hypothetical protein